MFLLRTVFELYKEKKIKNKKKYNISQEVFKFSYNGNFETNDNEMF